MQYLSVQEILVLHARIIEEVGGADGVRDVGLLVSATERPKATFEGGDLYPDIYSKAATYLDSLARNHVFVDGNKRTALVVTARFLFINGYVLTASNKEVETFVLKVATEKLELEDIAEWLKNHTKKLDS